MIDMSLQNMMIKSGAFNGESDSTSLHFELKHGWTGLLVEPHPLQVMSIDIDIIYILRLRLLKVCPKYILVELHPLQVMSIDIDITYIF